MPTYLYKCPCCGQRFDRVLPLVQYAEPQSCLCGTVAEKQIVAPAVVGDYAGYSCPVTGKWVEGRKAHQENLKRQGCRVLEPGETESFKRNKAAEEADFDRRIEETADRFIAELPAKKRESLASEMDAGVTATVTRQ